LVSCRRPAWYKPGENLNMIIFIHFLFVSFLPILHAQQLDQTTLFGHADNVDGLSLKGICEDVYMGIKVNIYDRNPTCANTAPNEVLLLKNGECIMWKGIGLTFKKYYVKSKASQDDDQVQITLHNKGCNVDAYKDSYKIEWKESNICHRFPSTSAISEYRYTFERHSNHRVHLRYYSDLNCNEKTVQSYPWLIENCWVRGDYSYKASCYNDGHVRFSSYKGTACQHDQQVYRINLLQKKIAGIDGDVKTESMCTTPPNTAGDPNDPNIESLLISNPVSKLDAIQLVKPYEDCGLTIEDAMHATKILGYKGKATITEIMLYMNKQPEVIQLVENICTKSECMNSYFCRSCQIEDFKRKEKFNRFRHRNLLNANTCLNVLNEITHSINKCIFKMPSAYATYNGYCIHSRKQKCSYQCNHPYKPSFNIQPWKCGITANPLKLEITFQSRSYNDQEVDDSINTICVPKLTNEVTCDAYNPKIYNKHSFKNTFSGYPYIKDGCQQGGQIGSTCELSCEPNYCCLHRNNYNTATDEYKLCTNSKDNWERYKVVHYHLGRSNLSFSTYNGVEQTHYFYYPKAPRPEWKWNKIFLDTSGTDVHCDRSDKVCEDEKCLQENPYYNNVQVKCEDFNQNNTKANATWSVLSKCYFQ
jgi:hypothetical protein